MRKTPGGRAKWSFHGNGFTLWAPRGPDYGSFYLLVDGNSVGIVDLVAPSMVPSAPVFTCENLAAGFHAVALQGRTGRLAVDGIEIHVRDETTGPVD